MNLNELNISRSTWGKDEGQFRGSISFDNELGKVDIKLTPEHCSKIFEVCAESIIDTAKQAAEELKITVVDHKKIIDESSQLLECEE